MMLKRRAVQVRTSIEMAFLLFVWLLSLSGIWTLTLQTAGAQHQTKVTAERGLLTTDDVVDKLVEMNLRRSEALHSYHGIRTYKLEYKSVFSALSAEMSVEVQYLAPRTKHFNVRSSTGSKLIIDRVFKKLLEAEEDALSKDGQRNTALNRDNYDFKMVGFEGSPSHSLYVLTVEPRTKSKFLYRGKLWVDANDFAVVRIEAEPAKNPSFWTKNNEIEQLYTKVNDFWLPKRNHSVSSIWLGGRADLTIDYQNYQITASDPVGNMTAHDVARSAKTEFTLDARKYLPAAPLEREP